MFDINNYINTSGIGQAVRDIQNITFQNIQSKGLFSLGFDPYTQMLGSFFWALTFGIIGISIYSWKGMSATIGYAVAIILITGAVIPASFANVFLLFLGLIITAVLYRLFMVKRKDVETVYKEGEKHISDMRKRFGRLNK